MNKLILVLLLGFTIPGFSQIDSINHFGGISTRLNTDNNFEGSPLLFSTWKRGEVELTTNQKLNFEKLNFDASRDVFEFKEGDSVYEFVDNIKEVRIYSGNNSEDPEPDTIFKTNVNPSSPNFVQVLAEGKITIFCEYNKRVEGENSTNGFVTTTRKYELYSNYYALIDKKAVPVKFNSSTLDDLTSDKKNQVDAYIKENKLKVKKEPDFLKVINFYNSIGS